MTPRVAAVLTAKGRIAAAANRMTLDSAGYSLYFINRTGQEMSPNNCPFPGDPPQYMTDCCTHSSDIARRQHLWSAGCHQLFVPRHRRLMFGRRTFSVAGPAAWNSLTDCLYEIRHVSLTAFAGT